MRGSKVDPGRESTHFRPSSGRATVDRLIRAASNLTNRSDSLRFPMRYRFEALSRMPTVVKAGLRYTGWDYAV
jgi:hypothetical protein